MNMRLTSLMAGAVFVAAAMPPAEPTAGFDGIERPRATDVAYRFECRNSVTTLRYQHRERQLEEAPLEDALSIELIELRVSGRTIPAGEQTEAHALFRSFAWIERVGASCYEGSVYLSIRAMQAGEWAASFRENPRQRPSLRLSTVRIAPDGSVTVS